MPALGFGSSVGSRLPDLANFPQSGLVALYKCDERSGDKLYDATDNLQPIQLYTGVALDNTTTASRVVDGTALHTALNDDVCDICTLYDLEMPALALTGTIHTFHRGTTASNAGFNVAITESNTFTGGNRFTLETRLRVSNDGGATASADTNYTATEFSGFKPSTRYQIILKFSRSGTASLLTMYYREGCQGPWATVAKTPTNATGTAVTIVAASVFHVLVENTTVRPFLGKARAVCIANGLSVSGAKNILDRPSITNVQNVLTGLDARYWDFGTGEGTDAQEWVTDAAVAITSAGTVTWAVAQTGGGQTAIRQGNPYYGRAGVRIGGESGHVPGTGYGTTPASDKQILSSSAGWSIIATLRVGNRVPASDQFLFSVYGPQLDGSYSTTPTVQPGAHIVLDDAALMRGVFKRAGVATSSAGTEVALGASAASAANGLFGTYAITCDATGLVSMKRVVTGDTSVTTQGTIAANVVNLVSYATRVAIGNASFGADLTIGFCAIYERALTDAEIMRCHTMSLARMVGEELWVLAAATGGNGSERYPYSDTLPAVRVHQPNQICNWGTGSYTRFNQSVAATNASSTSNITWRGTGSPTFVGGAGTGDYATILQGGSWAFSGIVWDAADTNFYAMTVSEDVTSVAFTTCEWKRGYQEPEPGNTATGSGMTCRAPLTIITNCLATDNDEHGVYFRLIEGCPDSRFTVDGLTVAGGGEDGLKVTNEGALGARWVDCIINRVKVTGGKNQLYLLGMTDSIVTNFLLLDQTSALADIAPLYLGNVQGFDGETLESDYPLVNVTVANGTISNTNTRGVWIKGDLASGSVTLHNIVCKDCADDYNDDTTAGTVTISHCAGDTAGDPFPAGTGMIPGATIAFTNAAGGDYTLTEESDGYGDGINLTGLSNEAEVMYDGTTRRPSTGAWNMGAY